MIFFVFYLFVVICLVNDVVNYKKLGECNIGKFVFLDKLLNFIKVIIINFLENGIIKWCVFFMYFIKGVGIYIFVLMEKESM